MMGRHGRILQVSLSTDLNCKDYNKKRARKLSNVCASRSASTLSNRKSGEASTLITESGFVLFTGFKHTVPPLAKPLPS